MITDIYGSINLALIDLPDHVSTLRLKSHRLGVIS